MEFNKKDPRSSEDFNHQFAMIVKDGDGASAARNPINQLNIRSNQVRLSSLHTRMIFSYLNQTHQSLRFAAPQKK